MISFLKLSFYPLGDIASTITPIVRIILQRQWDIPKPASGRPLGACFMTLSKSWTIFLLRP